MDPSIPNIVVNLTRTFGQVLIATFIATALWGMTCMQTLMYFVTYELDRWPLKSLVLSLLALDTVHEIICIHGLWVILIPKFGDIRNITVVHIPFALEPLFTGIIALMTQTFFAWRIWRFTDNNWTIPVTLFPLIIGQFVGVVMGVAKKIGTSLTFLESQLRSRQLMLGVQSIVAATNIVIALVMLSLLWRGHANPVQSDKRVLQAVNVSVSTGGWMAVLALIVIILAAAYPKDLFYVLGSIPLSPLYCNTVLANLNSRRPPRSARSNLVDVSIPGRRITESTPSNPKFAAPGLDSRTETVNANVSVEREADDEAKFRGYDSRVLVDSAQTTYD